MNRNWLYVFSSGILEIFWVSGLKHSETIAGWIFTVAALACSFYLVVLASRQLPVGTVYAVFAGIGTGGTVMVESLVFGEPFKLLKILLIVVLLVGVVGLKMVTANTEKATT
ncbi:DMT family transporter [Paenibacillus donghaensis]|uniref:QacE family quaternary ammonium compound efflux SMR transporter n=1 Tax=Paenibacillus donghaensis TaxID=414771 RepID=A0A2Z2KR96_9BACL|nr:SMR family transporter [Paenibacillus donghaensis]ASA26410.1 QacE family quaternary ammonium compound efflux SMR transporter [Paenibacillus donghaensis]